MHGVNGNSDCANNGERVYHGASGHGRQGMLTIERRTLESLDIDSFASGYLKGADM